MKTVNWIRRTLAAVSVRRRTMSLPHGAPASGHPIKASAWSLSYFLGVSFAFDACALLCHVSCLKVLCRWVTQVLSRDLEATLSALVCELSQSNSEDTLEEQAAVLLRLPQKLEDVCAQLCQKLQKVPLPTLSRLAAPLGSLHPLPPSKPPTNAGDDRVRCTVMALSGSVVAELFVLRGQPWLDAICHIPFGCWCHYWGVASFQLLEEDIVVFPRPRLSQRVPVHGPEVILKLITSDDPPPVNIRVVIGKAAGASSDYRPQRGTSPLYEFCGKTSRFSLMGC